VPLNSHLDTFPDDQQENIYLKTEANYGLIKGN